MSTINIKAVHERARRGAHINDDELDSLINHYRQLSIHIEALNWTPYQLVASDVLAELQRYEGYQRARRGR